MTQNLTAVFSPQSIAIVGASTDSHKVGRVILDNLINSGYSGKIYPVNPKSECLAGLLCYQRLTDINAPVEHVTICVPADKVLDIVKDCVTIHAQAITIISAGFGETGPEGKALEQKITQLCQDNHITLIGPNVIGIIHPRSHFNNSWMQTQPTPGHIAFVSQSGALCCSLLDLASQYGLGFSHFCSLGNKAGLNELDFVKAWLEDDDVHVIAAYLEDIKQGSAFIKLISEHPSKPVIIFHPGQSEAAANAIGSHTGSLATQAQFLTSAFAQAGIIQAHTLHQFCLYLSIFSQLNQPTLPQNNQVTVITNAGGAGIIAADSLAAHQLKLTSLPQETTTLLRQTLPPAASVNNPIDILGDASAERYLQAATPLAALAPTQVGILLFLLTPQYVTNPLATAQAIVDFAHQHPQHFIMTAFIGQDSVNPALTLLKKHHLPTFTDVEDAALAAQALVSCSKHLSTLSPERVKETYHLLSTVGQGQYQPQVQAFISDKPQVLPENLSQQLAQEVKLPLPASQLVTSLEQALAFAHKHFPVVLKVPNNVLAHKSDAQAVFTDITTPEQLTAHYHELLTKINSQSSTPILLIQEQVAADLEFFIGVKRHGDSHVYDLNGRGFGHLLTFGQGGIYTEFSRDHAFALVPQNRQALQESLKHTQIGRILQGQRGQRRFPIDSIVDAIVSIQKLCLLYPQIVSLDLNPLLINHQQIAAVDLKIYLEK
ncbi:acetate--CoA ligase family protein [bacterium]|nr:acetate--CoA ligase family protein [bacterium]